MAKSYEQISNNNASSSGKTNANLANDALHLGGIPAEEYATKKYVQDYHDNKETALRKYIDEQDNSKLNEAKEYTNSMIRNQDFSSFAKDTDVQALDTKLTGKIQECHTNCENKINDVVKDVNANFSDVTKGIENLTKSTSDLDSKYDELFQSVSDGKKKVAEAITDKGVTTSATDTFDTMAGNISNISSGGGGLDTSDATATENSILRNYTAYAKGQKITGRYDPSYVPEVPTYGIYTSDATASAMDIKRGKTAYVNGEKITGTLDTYYLEDRTIIESIPEIRGLSKDSYEMKDVANFLDTFDDVTLNNSIKEVVAEDIYFDESSGETYIARIVQEKISNELYVYFNPILSNPISATPYIAVPESTNPNDSEKPIQKKWRYSFSELGLDLDDCSPTYIKIGGERKHFIDIRDS